MTNAILLARLAEAGFDPALFTPRDLTLIRRAMRESQPVPEQPEIAPPAIPHHLLQPLLREIDDAVRQFGDLLAKNDLLAAFMREQLRTDLQESASAFGDAIPHWMRQAEQICTLTDQACSHTLHALDRCCAPLHRLFCLHAAAKIADSPDAAAYTSTLDALEERMRQAEIDIFEANAMMDQLDRLFSAQIPDLLETLIPLFSDADQSFSAFACRSAVLAIHETISALMKRNRYVY